MVEPVSGTGVLLFGAGAWLAGKIFGPSADALGKELQTYGSNRLQQIFNRAQSKLLPEDVKPLPPGFVMQFMQKASFSENDDLITNMWANLLIDASSSFRSRHNLFADVLSQIGASEAKFLNDLYHPNKHFEMTFGNPVDLRRTLFETLKAEINWSEQDSESRANGVISSILAHDFRWPVFLRCVESYWTFNKDSGATRKLAKVEKVDDPAVLNVLGRQMLIEHFDVSFNPGWASPRVEGFFMTNLGVDFVKSCRKTEVEKQ